MNKASKTLAIVSMIIFFAALAVNLIFTIANGIMVKSLMNGVIPYTTYTTILTVETVCGLLINSIAWVLALPALITGCIGLKKSAELKAKTNCGFAVGSSVIILFASGFSVVSVMISFVTPLISELF